MNTQPDLRYLKCYRIERWNGENPAILDVEGTQEAKKKKAGVGDYETLNLRQTLQI